MGLIINIDEALKLRTEYNILREPLNNMLAERQEAWEKQNPIDFLFTRSTISSFQETYVSSIGFDHAFAETSDYAIGPIFNTAEGFSSTYRTRTFQGSFIITQQTLEDRQLGRAKDDASAFVKRWHGDIVEYSMSAISSGFDSNTPVYWGSEANGGRSKLKLNSADTTTGEIDGVKNPLFCNKHTIVKREGMSDTDIQAAYQSNIFYIENVSLGSDDPGQIAKLADGINQVITIMENYKDDNNKYAGVDGPKTIVSANDARLCAALNTALSLDMFNFMGGVKGINPAYKIATTEKTPYLRDIPQTAGGKGFFIVDKAYNAANHGPELTERISFTLDVIEQKRPKGIIYDGRQRFDINAASWRGIAYVYIGTPAGSSGAWDDVTKFTKITPTETFVRPVSVVGTVTTQASE